MNAIALNLNSIIALTNEQFYQLCQANPDKFLPLAPDFVVELMSANDS